MSSLIISAVIGIIVYKYHCHPCMKSGDIKVYAINCAFLITGFIILAFASFDIFAPSPMKYLTQLTRTLFHFS